MPSSKSLHVFLCHSSGDKVAVRQLYQRLKSDGFDPWLDEENLLPGQDWVLEITKAVRDTNVVIVCISHGSAGKAGYVQKEIKFALDVADEQPEGVIFIVPAKLEECDVPDRLRRWHWVSLYEPNGYERLVTSLQRRASDLGIKDAVQTSVDGESPSAAEDEVEDDLYDEETSLEANTHMVFPCDLKYGEQINIDLKSDGAVDVLIMDPGDYQEWMDKGEVKSMYREAGSTTYSEFSERDNLHAFFTAREDGQYLIIVRNESDDEIEMRLRVSYVD